MEGMNGMLSDQEKVFEAAGPVTVMSENTPAADNQLTAGTYVDMNGIYTNSGKVEDIVTGLKDGVLMLDEKGGVKEGGWDWNRSTETLNINDKFSGNKQIVFASGINPKIKVNRSVTLNPDAGEAGIKTSGDLEDFY